MKSYNKPESCWIRYQLDLRSITLEDVAQKARCTIATVSRIISRKRHSEKTEAVLAVMLGYPSWQRLWAAAFVNAERKAV